MAARRRPLRRDRGAPQFVEHEPGCLVALESKLALQLKSRYARRSCARLIGCPEPQMDGRSGFVEDGSRCDRNLVVAAGALPEESLRQLEATGRTPESFGPPAGKEGLPSSGVICETVPGLDHRPQ